MATALSDGYIYILNWSPAGDDADAYDLDDGTEGTDYVKCAIPIKILETISTMKEPQDFPGGGSFIKALGYWNQLMMVSGLLVESTVTLTMNQVKLWKKFFHLEREDDDLFLCIKWGAGIYWPFVNGTSQEEFCQGALIREDLTFKWFHHKKFFVEVGFTWKNNFSV